MTSERLGEPAELARIVIGRVRTAFGVKGWLKVQSFTEPRENLLSHVDWWLSATPEPRVVAASRQQVVVLESQSRGADLLVKLEGLENREQAQQLAQQFISVPVEQLPALDSDEIYWHQLEGMRVYNAAGDDAGQESTKQAPVAGFAEAKAIGVVSHMLETGASDVLVIDADTEQAGQGANKRAKTLMLPYVMGYSVLEVDLEQRRILIDWLFEDSSEA